MFREPEVDAARDRSGIGLGESVQAFLRRVTRRWHDTVETAFAPFDIAASAGLGGFLRRQAAAVFPLEQALEEAGISERVPDWSSRRRGEALAADLRALGLASPTNILPFGLPSPAHALGGLYVLEGSKLGGRILLRRAQASPDARVHEATRFLGHHRPGEWPQLVALLQACRADELAGLQAGAEAAFTLFHAAATSDLTKGQTRPLVHSTHA